MYVDTYILQLKNPQKIVTTIRNANAKTTLPLQRIKPKYAYFYSFRFYTYYKENSIEFTGKNRYRNGIPKPN